MADLHRLRRLLLCVLVAMFGSLGVAHAAIPASVGNCTPYGGACYQYRAATTAYFATPDAACSATYAASSASGKSQYTIFNSSGPEWNCAVRNSSGSPLQQWNPMARVVATAEYVCPANSTLSGTTCTCNAPQWTQSGNACVQALTDKEELCLRFKSENLTSGPLVGLKPVNGLVCDESGYAGSYGGGCAVQVVGPTVTVTLPGEPPATAVEGAYTGAVCQGSAATPPATSASAPLPAASAPAVATNPCPNGQPGTVNGATVCIPYPPTATVESQQGQTKEVTNPDGTKVKTDITQQTVCQAGACNTTTTTTTTNINSSGTVTGTATTSQTATQPKGQFCAENPGATQCSDGEDSSFGGSCTGGFVCKGDAVQCAVAQEIHRQNCKWNDTTSAEYALYQANKGKTGDQTASLPGSESVNITAGGSGTGGFDMTDALGVPSSGLVDLPLTVAGRDVTIPFSNLNPYLVTLGNLLVAVSLLLGARIVVRG